MSMKLIDGELKNSGGSLWSMCRKDWMFLTLLLLLSSFLIFKNLGDLYLTLDEYDYAILGKNILKFGFPTMWDGKNFVAPESRSMYGFWGQHTWLPFYLMALSYLCFDLTPLATRFPFAVSGLISILLLYFLTFRITHSKKTARVASLLFSLSVSCLIYMRTGRYMSLTFLLSILCVWFYLDLIESKKGAIWKFTISLIAYFHAFFPQMIGLTMGVVFHLLVCERRNRNLRRDVFKSFIITFIFTFPWFALMVYPCQLKMVKALSEMVGIPDYSINPGLFFRIKNIFGFLAQINTYIFPFALIMVVGIIYLISKKSFNPKVGRKYILLLVSFVLCTILLVSSSVIPMQNYISGSLPILFILLSICFRYLYNYKRVLASMLLGLTLFSNIVHVSLWYPVGLVLNCLKKSTASIQVSPYFTRVENQVNRSKELQLLIANYLGEILTDFNGPQRAIVNYLLAHGNPDQTVLISHEANAITFFTDMTLVKNIPFLDYPDWIIPRGDYKFKGNSFYPFKKSDYLKQDEYVRNIIKNKKLYLKIILPVNDSGTENSYEVQCHSFSNYCNDNCKQVTLYQFIGKRTET